MHVRVCTGGGSELSQAEDGGHRHAGGRGREDAIGPRRSEARAPAHKQGT